MRRNTFLSLLLFIIICNNHALKAQTAYTEIYPDFRVTIDKEKLNVSEYAGKYKGSILDYSYTKGDGTLIRFKSYKKNSEIEVFENPPAPAIHYIYKIFYPNGNLKEKGVYLPRQVKIGKWIYCDNKGNCNIVDYEKDRSIYGYNDVLKFLQYMNYYNFTTGENTWECTFWHSPEGHVWGTRINKNGHQYKMYTFDDKGIEDIREDNLTPALNPVPIVGAFWQSE